MLVSSILTDGHATLHLAVLVRWFVHLSVHSFARIIPELSLFFSFYGVLSQLELCMSVCVFVCVSILLFCLCPPVRDFALFWAFFAALPLPKFPRLLIFVRLFFISIQFNKISATSEKK